MYLALPVYADVYIFSSEDGCLWIISLSSFWKSRASVRMPYLSMHLPG